MNIRYENCTPEDVRLLGHFEPEVRKAVVDKGVTGDVCWEGWVVKGETRGWRYFCLRSVTQPELYLAKGYGEGFLRRAGFVKNFV